MKFDIKVIVFCVITIALIWVSDAALDYFFFNANDFWNLLIKDAPVHILYFLIFGSIVLAYARSQEKRTKELKELDFKYRTVISKTNDWEFWKNDKGGYHYISPAFERVTGYLVEDLMKNPSLIKKIIHPDDLERVMNHLDDELKNTLEISDLEFRIVTQNNEVKNIKHICQPVYDKRGNFKGIRGSNVEIIKSATDSDETLFNKLLLEAYAVSTSDGLAVVNNKREVIVLNKRFSELWNLPTNLLNIKSETELIDFILDKIDDPDSIKDRLMDVNEDSSSSSKGTLTLKNGKNVDLITLPLKNSKGEYYGRLWCFREETYNILVV